MKTKELEKYPLQILMMTLTSFLTLLIPKLLSYLIDDILMANNKEKILPWFMITFGVTSLLMIMKFYFITYNPIKIGIKNTFRLQIKAAKDILNMNQSVYMQMRTKDIIIMCVQTVVLLMEIYMKKYI